MRKLLTIALISIGIMSSTTSAVAIGSGAVIASTAVAVAASIAASQMMNSSNNEGNSVSPKPLITELPKGWHYGIAVCGYPIEGKYCCVKRGWTGCELKIPFDEVPKYQNGNKYKVKPTGIVYFNGAVYIYYFWKKRIRPWLDYALYWH